MTIEQAQHGLARLKVCYPSSKPLDELTSEVYTETLMGMHHEDFSNGVKDIVQTLKFFPSIAELTEAVNYCKSRRLAWDERVARETRLLSGAQDAIMDPKADIHKRTVGPEHARFLRLLKGEEKFPTPAWTKKGRSKAESEAVA